MPPPSMGNPVLGPLFLIYINDLHTAIQYGKVYHFTDDKNLFHLWKPYDYMKYLNNWLSAYKICLNVEKTELVIFKSPRKVLLMKQKLNLAGKG